MHDIYTGGGEEGEEKINKDDFFDFTTVDVYKRQPFGYVSYIRNNIFCHQWYGDGILSLIHICCCQQGLQG